MSTDIYKPLIEKMRWSFSRITAFSQCPYGWYLKYIHGSDEEELFYASFGKFMHKLLEKFYKGEALPAELEAEFFSDFADSVIGERPQNIATYIEQGSKFLRELQKPSFEVLGVEKFVRFDIFGKKFVGVIDLLAKDEKGIFIVDHKSHKLSKPSGRSKPTKSDEELSLYLRQLYVYSAAIWQKYGVLPHKLCFNCFMNDKFIEVPFDMNAYEEAKQWAVDEISYIENVDDFYPRYDWFFCKNLCGFHNDCCYFDEWKRGAKTG